MPRAHILYRQASGYGTVVWRLGVPLACACVALKPHVKEASRVLVAEREALEPRDMAGHKLGAGVLREGVYRVQGGARL